MIVVSDTTPLNYLILIGQVQVLHSLFGHVVIAAAVARELTNAAAPAQVREFLVDPPPWIQVVQPTVVDRTLPRLGNGEAEAISLAIQLHADLLLCDDSDARRAAATRSVRVTGTLGVLELAAIAGLLDLPACIHRLRQTTIRLPERIIEQLLDDDRHRTGR